MTALKVLVTCRQMQDVMPEFSPRFDDHGIEVMQPEIVQRPTEAELITIIGQFDGMIAGDDPLTAEVLAHADRLRIISKWGVGTDGIDKSAAAARGIRVTNTPNVFGEEVADVAMGFVTVLARQLHRIDASVRDGGWLKVRGETLVEKSIGIIGFGSIGQAVGRRALGFGMTVLAYDVTDSSRAAAEGMGVAYSSLDDVLAAADYVVLCAPLNDATRHIIDAAALAKMRRGARLVNVSRGPLVDEASLVEALRSGHISAVGLDVFEEEPLPVASPLREFPECIFGSHNGSNTIEGVLRASALAVDNLFEGLGL